MATIPQRAVTIADALLNRTATAAERQRILDAFAPLLDPPVTNAQAAGAFVAALRHFVIEHVKAHESRTVAAVVNSDFAETP